MSKLIPIIILLSLTLFNIYQSQKFLLPHYCTATECIESPGFDNTACSLLLSSSSLIDQSPKSLLCPCKKNWSGKNCKTCAEGYSGKNCDSCDIGFGWSFPKCQRCQCNPLGLVESKVLPCFPRSAAEKPATCQCATGYTGAGCFDCQDGYWRDKTSHCDACPCSAMGTIGRGCNMLTGKCFCAPGFGGERCDRCENPLSSYPDCAGGFAQQNLDSIALVSGVVSAILLSFLFFRCCFPKVENHYWFALVLWVAKVCSDLWVLTEQGWRYSVGIIIMLMLLIFIPWIINLSISLVFLYREHARSVRFVDWWKGNFLLTLVVTFLSVGGVKILLLLRSRLFKQSYLCAPIARQSIRYLLVAAVLSSAILLLPQIIVMIWFVNKIMVSKRSFPVLLLFTVNFLQILYVLLSAITNFPKKKRRVMRTSHGTSRYTSGAARRRNTDANSSTTLTFRSGSDAPWGSGSYTDSFYLNTIKEQFKQSETRNPFFEDQDELTMASSTVAGDMDRPSMETTLEKQLPTEPKKAVTASRTDDMDIFSEKSTPTFNRDNNT